MSIAVLRKRSTTVLSSKKIAEKYETAIYNMAVRVAKRDGQKITEVYPVIAYDKLGQIVVAKTSLERHKILNDLKNAVEDWDSCVYNSPRSEYNRMMDRSIQKPKAVKGVYVCKQKNCGSDEFYVWSQQTRSSDEGMSQMRQCAHCGKRRKE